MIRDLAARLALLTPRQRQLLSRRRSVSPTLPVGTTGAVPLSFSQHLWLPDQRHPGSAAFHVPLLLRLEGPLLERPLARALAEVVRRHQVLRITISPGPYQSVTWPAGQALARVDLAASPGPGTERAGLDVAFEEIDRPFDLARGPLFRSLLVRLDAQTHLLVLVIHHLVGDGWSCGILLRELGVLYRAFAAGQPSPLPELALQYADFACWQRRLVLGPELDGELEYWRQSRLDAVPPLELSAPRPAQVSARGAMVWRVLDARLADGLRALARVEGATLFMALFAGVAWLLHGITGREDLVVGSPTAGRLRRDVEDLIGCFSNVLPIRTQVRGRPSFRRLLGGVRQSCMSAFAHQQVPLPRLIERLGLPRPPFSVMFALQNAPRRPLELPGLRVSRVPEETRWSLCDLAVSVAEKERELKVVFEYRTDLLEGRQVSAWAAALESLLREAVADPDRPLGQGGQR